MLDELDRKYAAHSAAKIGQCRYNSAIDCDKLKICAYCGWNPLVARERAIRIREELRGKKKRRWMLGSGTF